MSTKALTKFGGLGMLLHEETREGLPRYAKTFPIIAYVIYIPF